MITTSFERGSDNQRPSSPASSSPTFAPQLPPPPPWLSRTDMRNPPSKSAPISLRPPSDGTTSDSRSPRPSQPHPYHPSSSGSTGNPYIRTDIPPSTPPPPPVVAQFYPPPPHLSQQRHGSHPQAPFASSNARGGAEDGAEDDEEDDDDDPSDTRGRESAQSNTYPSSYPFQDHPEYAAFHRALAKATSHSHNSGSTSIGSAGFYDSRTLPPNLSIQTSFSTRLSPTNRPSGSGTTLGNGNGNSNRGDEEADASGDDDVEMDSPTSADSSGSTQNGVPRLPPIMQVEKQHVTTSATQAASASRRRNDALFKCPVPGCGSTFTRRFNLRGHLRSHTEERPFVCEWPGCGKGFARKHDCNRHQGLHSAKSVQHTCSGCGKAFSRMDALNRHLRSEGGSTCRKSGATPANSGTSITTAPTPLPASVTAALAVAPTPALTGFRGPPRARSRKPKTSTAGTATSTSTPAPDDISVDSRSTSVKEESPAAQQQQAVADGTEVKPAE